MGDGLGAGGAVASGEAGGGGGVRPFFSGRYLFPAERYMLHESPEAIQAGREGGEGAGGGLVGGAGWCVKSLILRRAAKACGRAET